MPSGDDRPTPGAERTDGPGAAADGVEPTLVAYRVSEGLEMPLVPAARERTWMAETDRRFAYRCLPLLMANQGGWFVLTTHRVRATWDGGLTPESLSLDYLEGTEPYPAASHFGSGILTWRIPYLFRTPPSWNLLARGPANWPKDGVCPLEGLVETDWAVATFTMNWKLTRPGLPVVFEPREPICMVVPRRRGELERFRPELSEIDAEATTAAHYREWLDSRRRFNAGLKALGSSEARTAWQRHYFRGTSPSGAHAPEHQVRASLMPFPDDS